LWTSQESQPEHLATVRSLTQARADSEHFSTTPRANTMTVGK
jgi:hypothetical protein